MQVKGPSIHPKRGKQVWEGSILMCKIMLNHLQVDPKLDGDNTINIYSSKADIYLMDKLIHVNCIGDMTVACPVD